MLSEQAVEVQIWVLGPPRGCRRGQAEVALSRKDAALLAWLALDGEQQRDRVAAWLWPDGPLASAKLNLRQRLFKLRQLIGPALDSSGSTLRLAPGVWVDVQAPTAGDDGVLLGSFDYGDLGSFDDWVQSARQRLAQRQVDQWAGEAALLESQGALARAIELCQRIIAAAPTQEHGWRRLMRLHYLRGDRAAAVAAYQRFERTVCAEQGSRPAAETLALLRLIEQSDPRRASAGPLPTSLVRPPRLVGRETVLQTLDSAWAAGRAVLVLGDAGIGKSHLLRHAVHERPGVVQTQARPGDASLPYACVNTALQQALERYSPTLQQAHRQQLARLLPALGQAPRGPGQQATLWAAVEQLLQACRRQGLSVLVIDDLHWADPASLELLRWLMASPALQGLAMAFAARPAEPGPAAELIQAWTQDPVRVETLPLQALTRDQVGELLDSLQLTLLSEAGPTLAEALHRHAGGHPFDLLETLKALVLSGELPHELPRPPAVGSRIAARLQRLTPGAQDLLRVAALAGDDLPVEAAAQVLGTSALALAPAWLELESAQVMQGTRFAHDLVREAALSQVPQALRPTLHAQLAQALQAHPQVPASRLAEHWWQAGRWPAAALCWRQAAAAAHSAGRLAEHQALLEQAAQAHDRAGDAEGHFDARCRALATLLIQQGERSGLAAIDQLQARAHSEEQQARLDVLRAEAWLNLMQFDDALAASSRALRAAPADSEVAADAVTLHGRALALTGKVPEGVALLEAARAQAAAGGDHAREQTAAAALAHALTAAGRRGEAFEVQQRVVELAQSQGDDTELGVHTANLATLAFMTGRAESAWCWAADAARRLSDMGAAGVMSRYNAMILARSAASLGRLDESEAVLQPLLEAAAGDASPNIVTQARVALCGVWLWCGQNQRALSVLPEPDPAAHPLALAGARLNRLRAHQLAGADPGPCAAALSALVQADPALFDDPVLCLELTRHGPAASALERLQRVQAALRGTGCDTTLRSLAVREVQRLQEIDAAAAARLASQLSSQADAGLHPATYPPEAWWTLCQALRDSDATAAEACRQRALAWIHQATLPAPGPGARTAFEQGNPLNRVVLGSTPITAR